MAVRSEDSSKCLLQKRLRLLHSLSGFACRSLHKEKIYFPLFSHNRLLFLTSASNSAGDRHRSQRGHMARRKACGGKEEREKRGSAPGLKRGRRLNTGAAQRLDRNVSAATRSTGRGIVVTIKATKTGLSQRAGDSGAPGNECSLLSSSILYGSKGRGGRGRGVPPSPARLSVT